MSLSIPRNVAIIDGDIITYRVGWACQKRGEDPEPIAAVLHTVKVLLDGIQRGAGCRQREVYLTGKNNFREKIATIQEYKGDRKELEKPYHYDNIRNYLIEYHGAIVSDGCEADDLLGIRQYESFVDNSGDPEHCDTVLCSLDKDLRMIPGWHFNWVKMDEEEGEEGVKYWVTEQEATHWFWTQVLTGDTTDNILGVPGIGPAKAKKYLAELFGEPEVKYYQKCLEVYATKYENAEEALLENARLLWIQRYDNQEWRPPEA